jgi:Zn-dependent protease
MTDMAYQISTWILPALIAITLHEAAHGFVAWRLGDDTAKRLGRVTFNPLKHIDPFGTVILPAMLLLASGGRLMFGFAKPVPVNFSRLRRPRRDMVLVAAAGPGINIGLAIAAAAALTAIPALPGAGLEWVGYNLFNAVWLNVLLAVFNMLPLPPLDGGRVAVGLLPDVLAVPLSRLERYGFLIILGIVFVLPLLARAVGVDLGIIEWLVLGPAQFLSRLIFSLVGFS